MLLLPQCDELFLQFTNTVFELQVVCCASGTQ